ncbi:MAG: tetratricopeptide repeat protein [Candidatus Hydrogenedentes bacterium]|nr:tetratricopeptide repeat protein [Candidatus Hydrogenedentota bacterium]
MAVSDTVETMEMPPSLPRGAQRVFLVVGGVGFIILVACLVAYGVFGERITAGLDDACAEASLDAGLKMEMAGNSTQAILKYRQALAGTIADDELRYRCIRSIGDLLYRDKRYSEAVAMYRQLPAEAFDTSGAYAGYSGALWSLGEAEEALQLSEPWLALALKEGNVEQEVWARESIMRGARVRGDVETEMAQCRRIIAVAPCDDAVLRMAVMEHDQGDVPAARQRLEAFLKDCDNPAWKKSARTLLEKWTGES